MITTTTNNSTLVRKTQTKFLIRRWFGEPYVGKRMKLRHLSLLLRDLRLPDAPRLLEAGSGDGVFTAWLAKRWPDATVEGIELDPEEVTGCNLWAQQSGRKRLHFREGNILEMEEEGVYDLVICLDVLEHILEDHEAVRRMMRALKPGGWLVVNCPNVIYQRLDGSKHTVPPEDAYLINPGHVRNGYAPEEMRALLESASPAEVQVHPRHGRLTDLAHKVYRKMENPTPLRLMSLPIIDALWALDVLFPSKHRNTVFGMARKSS